MKIIQITDTHLVPPGQLLHGLDPAARLRAVVSDVCARHADADLVIVTGDLCNDGDPRAYALLRELLAPIASPLRLLLGNHDARPAFVQAFPEQPVDAHGFVQSHIDTPHGRLLLLDTHHPNTIGGRYCAQRQQWLADALAGAGDQPVTVFMHHPPLPDGLAHFAHIGLHDADAVMGLLRGHSGGVRHIVFGHLHVAMTGVSADGFAYSSGQACAHQFITDPDNPTPWWTEGTPCYRVLMLDANGFRAYAAQVGQTPTAQTQPCAGP